MTKKMSKNAEMKTYYRAYTRRTAFADSISIRENGFFVYALSFLPNAEVLYV